MTLSFPNTGMLIGDRWHEAASTLALTNPSDGSHLADIADGQPGDIDAAIGAARASEWHGVDAASRGRYLMALKTLVEAHQEDLAQLESKDVGKPLSQARADAAALARYLEFYAGAADKLHGQTLPYLEGYTVFTQREPHGVTGHIIPWNYPMQIIGRSVVGALTAGNACVIKPSEEACLTALAFGQLALEAGLPAGAVNIVPGLGEIVGAALAGHGDVDHISFTGSFAVGGLVQAAAGRNAVPVTLELGGKSPQIVFADADVEAALPFLIKAGLQNAGQTCSAASRILVEAPVYEDVCAAVAERYQALTIGPASDDKEVGPLVSQRQKQIVERYLEQAGDLTLLAKAALPEGLPPGGAYAAPHVFKDVPADHPLALEEVFGPVQTLQPFETEAQAVALANGTGYGLVAGVWTKDGARQMRLAKQLKAGQVFINTYGAGGGVELPFGGVGKSGHGREKGFEALYAFTRLKTVAAHHG